MSELTFDYKESFVDRAVQVLVGIDNKNKIHKSYFIATSQKQVAERIDSAVNEYISSLARSNSQSELLYSPKSLAEMMNMRMNVEKAYIDAGRPEPSKTIVAVMTDGKTSVHATDSVEEKFPLLLAAYKHTNAPLDVFERYDVIRDITNSVFAEIGTARKKGWASFIAGSINAAIIIGVIVALIVSAI